MRELKFKIWNISVQRFLSENESYMFTLNDMKYDDPHIFCQFTGLKDKNGVEIYEGDYFLIHTAKWAVEWHNDLSRYVLTNGFGYDSINCIELNCDCIYIDKISGNIYENPESL